MKKSDILAKVDHTQLKAYATWEDIQSLCEEALFAHTASVCVPPCYAKRVKESYPALTLCVVIGFPLGYSVREAKVTEACSAIRDGADEVDMVINITDAKNGAFDQITEEIRAVKKAVGPHVLKVILETCYLTKEEKIALCRCVTEGGADFIKTSTGFGSGGATLEDIRLFKAHIGPGVKIKAAGGMKSKEDLLAFAKEGVDRLGTSSAMKLLRDEEDELE